MIVDAKVGNKVKSEKRKVKNLSYLSFGLLFVDKSNLDFSLFVFHFSLYFSSPIFSNLKSVAENQPVVAGLPVMFSSVVTP